MSENVKVSLISGTVSVLVAICSTIGVIYSQKNDLNKASSVAESAVTQVRTLRSEIAGPNLPSGAVVAFRLVDCPENWEPYELAKGRVIVGSGTGYNLTPKTLEEFAGEERTILVNDNIPAHSHYHDDWHYYDQAKKAADYATKEGDDTGNIIKKRRMSEPTGKGLPHNNMQPYVALLYCRKI
ncbi:hypothetical protein J7384_18445 [Endozoicomonas sp. G2_1]|uniref:hypothetical protein n=1 Tax=Endozoicomonas sp. G2_1 TaxID=2821091 RepID=UPI001ADB5EEF|nr:hypothetical protein [Endozoicomonas sp. G2_1]MBO9492348.1 hypothetical protein [Endozoicomonas sp. G2_1]